MIPLDFIAAGRLFSEIYVRLCEVAYRHHLETGDPIEYEEIARMAKHMARAGARQEIDDPTST